MNNSDYCPVPKEQIPSIEFKLLSKDWFFKKIIGKKKGFLNLIFGTFLFSLPLFYFIGEGSYVLQHDLVRLLLFILIGSL